MSRGAIINVIIFIVLIFAVVGAVFVRATPGKYNAFAQCITEKEAVFYGAWWCPACSLQKKAFGRDAKTLPYLECSLSKQRGGFDNSVCIEEKILSTPTWSFKNNENRYNLLSRESLSYLTQCPLSIINGEENLEHKNGVKTLTSILPQIGREGGVETYTQALLEQFNIRIEEVSGTEIAKAFADLAIIKTTSKE